MKWFEHHTDCGLNKKFRLMEFACKRDKIDFFAHYGRVWRLYEIVGHQGEEGIETFVLPPNYGLEVLADDLKMELDDLKRFLSLLAELSLIDPASWKQETVFIPKIWERRDNYTKKKERPSSPVKKKGKGGKAETKGPDDERSEGVQCTGNGRTVYDIQHNTSQSHHTTPPPQKHNQTEQNKEGSPAAPVSPPSTKKKGKKTPLPENFGISDRVKEWAKENRYHRPYVEANLEYFIGYVQANGKTYTDWDQAFMNCIRDNWAKAENTKPPEYGIPKQKPVGTLTCDPDCPTCGGKPVFLVGSGRKPKWTYCEFAREVFPDGHEEPLGEDRRQVGKPEGEYHQFEHPEQAFKHAIAGRKICGVEVNLGEVIGGLEPTPTPAPETPETAGVSHGVSQEQEDH